MQCENSYQFSFPLTNRFGDCLKCLLRRSGSDTRDLKVLITALELPDLEPCWYRSPDPRPKIFDNRSNFLFGGWLKRCAHITTRQLISNLVRLPQGSTRVHIPTYPRYRATQSYQLYIYYVAVESPMYVEECKQTRAMTL